MICTKTFIMSLCTKMLIKLLLDCKWGEQRAGAFVLIVLALGLLLCACWSTGVQKFYSAHFVLGHKRPHVWVIKCLLVFKKRLSPTSGWMRLQKLVGVHLWRSSRWTKRVSITNIVNFQVSLCRQINRLQIRFWINFAPLHVKRRIAQLGRCEWYALGSDFSFSCVKRRTGLI